MIGKLKSLSEYNRQMFYYRFKKLRKLVKFCFFLCGTEDRLLQAMKNEKYSALHTVIKQ